MILNILTVNRRECLRDIDTTNLILIKTDNKISIDKSIRLLAHVHK